MSRWILPVAVALALTSVMVGAYGQSNNAEAAGQPATAVQHHRAESHQTSEQAKAKQQAKAKSQQTSESWRVWCKHNAACLRAHPWTARGNPEVRLRAFRKWCLKHPSCLAAHPNIRPRYLLSGPTGAAIRYLPEGRYVATFIQAAHAYGVSARVLMGIGVVESGGGVAGTAYMGCMNSSTFGSWTGQIYCAATVLANHGLSGYNAVNPSYPSTVMGKAEGITIVAE